MAKLHIRPDVVKGHINPEIQGHFSEHLGRCIYEGLYVGENSPIPNTNGMRNDVVEALKEIHIPSSATFIQNESEETSSAFKSYSTESGIINVTIYAPKGSYAEKYAKQENIKFVAE